MTDPRMFHTPLVRVGIADSRKRYYDIATGDEPFFMYDRVGELLKQKKMASSYFPANTTLQFGNKSTAHCVPVDRKWLKGAMLRPMYRQPIPWGKSDGATPPSYTRPDGTPMRRWGVVTVPDQSGIDPYDRVDWGSHPPGTVLNDFWDNYTFYPTAGANWDFTLPEDGLLWEMTQKVAYTGDGSSASDWTVTQVGFDGSLDALGVSQGQAPNPFFTVGFRRQGLPPEFQTALNNDAENLANLFANLFGNPAYAYVLVGVGTVITWGIKLVADANGPAFPEGKWALQCNITGKPKLYERMTGGASWGEHAGERYWQPRDWTEGDLSEIKAETAAKTGYTYHIGTMGHAICVCEGGYDGDDKFAYYLVEDASEPIVPAGGVLVTNYPGQFTCWLDLNVFPSAIVERWPFSVPSFRAADVTSYVHGEPFSTVLQDALDAPADATVVSTLSQVEGMSASLFPLGVYQDMTGLGLLRYKLMMNAGTYPIGADPTAEVVTQTAPFVEAVTLFQNPQLTENGAATFTETDRAVKALVTTQEQDEDRATQHELVVDNRISTFTKPEGDEPTGGWSPTYNFKVGRQVEVQQAGWKMVNLNTQVLFDQSIPLGQYYIVQPGRRSTDARFLVTDLLGMLALECWEGETDLNFRGWTVADAIAFGLEWQGVGPGQYDLEDAGLYVPDDDKHVWKRGTSWLKIYQDLLDGTSGRQRRGPKALRLHNGAIWYDWTDGKIKTGCRFCRTKRTALTLLAHADNGWASSACLATDLARVPVTGVDVVAVEDTGLATDPASEYLIPMGGLEVTEASLDVASYANSIVVAGKMPRAPEGWNEIVGRKRTAKALDPAGADTEDAYKGFVISRIVEDEALETQAQVYNRVAELSARLAPEAMRVKFKIPLLTTMKPGLVVQIEGGKWAGCHLEKFRVTGVRHDPADAMTEISGRQMLGLPTE